MANIILKERDIFIATKQMQIYTKSISNQRQSQWNRQQFPAHSQWANCVKTVLLYLKRRKKVEKSLVQKIKKKKNAGMDFLAFIVTENLSTFVGCDDETGAFDSRGFMVEINTKIPYTQALSNLRMKSVFLSQECVELGQIAIVFCPLSRCFYDLRMNWPICGMKNSRKNEREKLQMIEWIEFEIGCWLEE